MYAHEIIPRCGWAAFCFVPLMAFASGCSKAALDTPASADRLHLPAFSDIPSAPSNIQNAARAVVRIRTAGSSGTGAFVSGTGLLLTNNHVLGAGVCPLEGCQIQLTFMHQRGAVTQSMTVLAVPTAVDVGLDMAVLQIFESPGVGLASPYFLNIVDHDAGSLVGQHVTVVGHPEGDLKKWTDGVVTDSFGEWFESDAYILPGSSGSPLLDDEGNLVGLLHRASTGEDLITSDSVNVASFGTASAPIHAAMSAPLPSVMLSLSAPATQDEIVAHQAVYLNGLAAAALVGTTQVSVLTALGQACDAALARTDFQSPDDLSSALAPCNAGMLWIECRVDQSPVPYGVVCPMGPDAMAWANRFQAMNRAAVAMNGDTDLTPVSFGIAALEASKSAGLAAGGSSLQSALTAAGQDLDFGRANYLAAFDIETYEGTNTLAWLRGYASNPNYALSGLDIASAFLWWYSNGQVSPKDTLVTLQGLDANPDVGVGAKLYIEDVEYNSGD